MSKCKNSLKVLESFEIQILWIFSDLDMRDATTQIKDFENHVPALMSAGYASFHHPLMMHGSFENTSYKQRRATVINVFGDGVISNLDLTHSESPGTNKYPKVPRGEKMCGGHE